MKRIMFCLFFVIAGFVSAEVPRKLKISVADGTFDGGWNVLLPSLQWEDSLVTNKGNLDVEYGIVAKPTTINVKRIGQSLWGRARKKVNGIDLAARAEMDLQDMNMVYLDFDLEKKDVDLKMHVVASADVSRPRKSKGKRSKGGIRRRGRRFSIDAVTATKTFERGDTKVIVMPRFDIGNNINDVVVRYSLDKTDVTITASGDAQKLTVSQELDKYNRFAPSVSSNGDLSLLWERKINNERDSKLTAILTPNKSLNVKWNDSFWQASLNLPLDGQRISESSVMVKRDMTF